MALFKYFPIPNERMGRLWSLSSISDSVIIEFGPMGTSDFALFGFMHLNFRRQNVCSSTHLTDWEIVMGNADRLRLALKEAEEAYHPSHLFVLNSSVGDVIGMDLDGALCEWENEYTAQIVSFPDGGITKDFTYGTRDALNRLATLVAKESVDKIPRTYNLLGCCIDDFNYQADILEFQRMMESYFDAKCLCCFPAGATMEQIEHLGGAECNLVIRTEALAAAQTLEKRMGTPFVFGRPYGYMETLQFLEHIERVTGWTLHRAKVQNDTSDLRLEINRFSMMLRRNRNYQKKALISGNYDTVFGLKSYLENELKLDTLCWTNSRLGKDIPFYTERQWEDAIQTKFDVILSDGVVVRCTSRPGIVISNPCMYIKKYYHYTPFVGFRGAMYLLELLYQAYQTIQ